MAGLNYPDLLDDFERGFIRDISRSYQRFGAKTRISEKQQNILAGISRKLCVD
jgi:hypothetical protein